MCTYRLWLYNRAATVRTLSIFSPHKQPSLCFCVFRMWKFSVMNHRHIHQCGPFYRKASSILLYTSMPILLIFVYILSVPSFIFPHLCLPLIFSVFLVVIFLKFLLSPICNTVPYHWIPNLISFLCCLTTVRSCPVSFLWKLPLGC